MKTVNVGLIVLFLAFLCSFQGITPATSHCWIVSENVPPVDDPSTPAVENELTLPDGNSVKNTGKKGDPSVKVKYCSGCESHLAHSEIDSNGAGNNLTVEVSGSGTTVLVNAGTGQKAGARISVTGLGNTVRTSGDKNCAADGGKKNTITFGPGQNNHAHSYPLPPVH